MQAILDGSPAADWQPLDPAHTLVLHVGGHPVVLALATAFAPKAAANIVTLTRGGYFDTAAIVRVQDNYVAQWADPAAEDPHPVKGAPQRPLGDAARTLPMETSRPVAGLAITLLPERDTYAARIGFADGFPLTVDGPRAALAHCYGMVGVARDNAPDTGNGSELYAVIGQSPRALDGNVTLAGRVVWGMEYLSSLPRGTGKLGFYTDRSQNVAIGPVRLLADDAEASALHLERLRTDSPTFRAVIAYERGPRSSWFLHAPGHIGLCETPLPVRKTPG